MDNSHAIFSLANASCIYGSACASSRPCNLQLRGSLISRFIVFVNLAKKLGLLGSTCSFFIVFLAEAGLTLY
jgi:hypothetical protein